MSMSSTLFVTPYRITRDSAGRYAKGYYNHRNTRGVCLIVYNVSNSIGCIGTWGYPIVRYLTKPIGYRGDAKPTESIGKPGTPGRGEPRPRMVGVHHRYIYEG